MSEVHNVRAEQSLLGALLVNNKSIEHVIEFLRPEHFSESIHGEIYRAIKILFEQGRQANDVTLGHYFTTNPALENVGGMEYLMGLMRAVISVVSVKDYGELIYDLFLRRELIQIGETIVQDARNAKPDTKAMATVEDAEKKLYNLVVSGQSENVTIPFSTALTDAIKRAELAYRHNSHVVGVTTGFQDVDRMLGGFHPSDLLIIAGRPSMGKTALATNMAFNAARTDKEQGGGAVAFFSLEMSAEQLAGRILSAESQIPSDCIRRGELKFEDFPRFVQISEELSHLPLYIDDTPGITITSLRNRARRMKRQFQIQLIIIDYLQLITIGGNYREGRVQEVSEITRALKGLAKELDVPVVALSQLSRAVEQRDDKRPQLSDLRESGTIEQDADVVMFVYRQEYYESRKKPEPGTEEHAQWMERMEKVHNRAELIVAKQRHGPIGTVNLFYNGRLVKFGNLARYEGS